MLKTLKKGLKFLLMVLIPKTEQPHNLSLLHIEQD